MNMLSGKRHKEPREFVRPTIACQSCHFRRQNGCMILPVMTELGELSDCALYEPTGYYTGREAWLEEVAG